MLNLWGSTSYDKEFPAQVDGGAAAAPLPPRTDDPMLSPKRRTPLRDSAAVHSAAAVDTGRSSPDARLEVTLVLKPPEDLEPARARVLAELVDAHPLAGPSLSVDDVHALRDPGADAFDRVLDFARDFDLRVVDQSRLRRDVVVEGSVAQVEKAFGVELHHFGHPGGSYRGHHGPVDLPVSLSGVVDAVLGLENRPLHNSFAGTEAAQRTSVLRLSPQALARHYAFPASPGAAACRVALVEFAGGYHGADVSAYAERFRLPRPRVRAFSVAGGDEKYGANRPMPKGRLGRMLDAWDSARTMSDLPGDRTQVGELLATLEVTMDVELVAGLAGGAAVDVHFAPPGADGWRRVFFAALGEPVGDRRRVPRPVAVSVSWGGSESEFGPMYLRALHQALEAAAHLGITVCCASGDIGSSNTPGGSDRANVNFPASSPAVLACGGTRLLADSRTIVGETAWKGEMLGAPTATGGGMSGYFQRPAWQTRPGHGTPKPTWLAGDDPDFDGRWLPDVAASADFGAGPGMVVAGQDRVGGGTSAATPIWASLVTRLCGRHGRGLGYLNRWLYAAADECCRDVSGGDNDVTGGRIPYFRAEKGWNACTGWGVPVGQALAARLAREAG